MKHGLQQSNNNSDSNVQIGGDVNGDITINNYGPNFRYEYNIDDILLYYRSFVGRTQELQFLADITVQQEPSYILITASLGYGKSALMADVISRHKTNPELSDRQLLYFFIIKQRKNNCAQDFLQAINSQLLQLLERPDGVPSALDQLRMQFSELWQLACKRANPSAPLLLLIDGLDEMADEEITIADVLPNQLTAYVHVVVTSRPNPDPKHKLDLAHPIQQAEVIELGPLSLSDIEEALLSMSHGPIHQDTLARIHSITHGMPIYVRFVCEDVVKKGTSVLTALERNPPNDVKEYFERQLEELGELADNHELIWEVLGILSVTIGDISEESLAEILQTLKRKSKKVIKAIERYLRGEKQYELMHDLLRQAVEAELPSPKENYLQKLLDWCKSYQARKWPEDTPAYILRNYADHLITANERASFYALVDKQWMQRKWQEPKLLMSFADDMEKVINRAGQSNPIDWIPLIRSCLAYTTFTSFYANVSPILLSTLVYVGEHEVACQYADLIFDTDKRDGAYELIVEACIEVGELEAALIAAEKQKQIAAHSDFKANSKIANELIRAKRTVQLARMGDFRQAIEVVENIDYDDIKVWTYVRIAQHMSELDPSVMAYAVVKQFLANWIQQSKKRYAARKFNLILRQLQLSGLSLASPITESLRIRHYAIPAPQELQKYLHYRTEN